MLCCKERHDLLFVCSTHFLLRCIMMIRGASDSTHKPLLAHYISLLTMTNITLHKEGNIPDFRHPLSPGDWTMCCKERHSLLIACFITFCTYMRMFERVYTSPLWLTPCHLYQNQLSNFMQDVKFPTHSQKRKWDNVSQGETCIAD